MPSSGQSSVAKVQLRFPGSSVLRRAVRRIGILGLTLAPCGCSEGLFDARGPIAAAQMTILVNSLGIMLAIIIPTILATLGVAWWFRASNQRAHYKPDWEYSGRIEMIVWSIPAMTILLLGGICWIGSHDLDPPRPIASNVPPLHVQVVSLDWKWLFIYPDQGVASVNRLVVPAGTPISFQLTSSGVMNGFLVPQLGSMIYAMAGMVTQLNLQADQPGTYPGLSTVFSGDGFPEMTFTVEAVPPASFTQSLAAMRGAGKTLDANSYAELAKPGIAPIPITYGSVAPGLFATIARPQAAAAAPPHTGHANSPKED